MFNVTIMYLQQPVLEFNFDTGDVKFFCVELIPWYLRGSIMALNGLNKDCPTVNVPYLISRNVRAMTEYIDRRLNLYGNLVSTLTNKFPFYGFDIKKTALELTYAITPDDMYWIYPDVYKHVPKSFRVDTVNVEDLIVTSARSHKDIMVEVDKLLHADFSWDRHCTLFDDSLVKSYGCCSHNITMLKLLQKLGGSVMIPSVQIAGNVEYTYRPAITYCEELYVPAIDYYKYCCMTDQSFSFNSIVIDKESFNRLIVFDYLTANVGRALNQWGFMYNINTQLFTRVAPITDCKGCFQPSAVLLEEARSTYIQHMTMFEAAKHAVASCNSLNVSDITASDFSSDLHYKDFTKRCKTLRLC